MGNCTSSSSTGDAPQFSDLNGNPPVTKSINQSKKPNGHDDSDNLNAAAQRYIVKITSHGEEKVNESINQSNNQLIISDQNELSQSLYQSNQSTNQSINQSESTPVIASIAQYHQSSSPPIQSINQSVNSAPVKKMLDPKDFMLANRSGETIVRNNQSFYQSVNQSTYQPGDQPPIDGQSFSIEYCKDCTIVLIDWFGQLTIDDCENCTFIIGPVESSIFIRQSINCKIVVSCQQIRIRDCENLSVSLLVSASQPVMESSKDIKLMGYNFNFLGLEAMLKKAAINQWDTQWSNVHDFFSQSINQSADQSEKTVNYSYLPHNPALIIDSIKHLLVDANQLVDPSNQSIVLGEQIVPFTWGNREIDQSTNQSGLILADSSKTEQIWKLIESLKLDNQSVTQSINQPIDNPYKLIRTKIMQGKNLQNNQSFVKQLLTQSNSQSAAQLIGQSLVGLEINGPDVNQAIIHSINQLNLEGVIVTNATSQSVDQFFASPQI